MTLWVTHFQLLRFYDSKHVAGNGEHWAVNLHIGLLFSPILKTNNIEQDGQRKQLNTWQSLALAHL